MQSVPSPAIRHGRPTAFSIGISCLSMLVCAYATAQTPPTGHETDPVLVTDVPLKLPHKHRTVKPGQAKPPHYTSNPQPLLKTLRQTRSAK